MGSKTIFSKQLVRLLSLILLLLVFGVILFFKNSPDGKLHLIFCNVGQGDAILIITPAGDQLLVDGGPDNSVLSCLGQNLPFYDRKLELVVLTHPQADHMVGLISVFKNYKIAKILKSQAVNETAAFGEFTQVLGNENAQEFRALAGSLIKFGSKADNLLIKILWPPKEKILLGEDLNNTSIVLEINFGKFCALLAGDATNLVFSQLLAKSQLKNCALLKVAHHGSKNATNSQFLDALRPKIAVISAGANNRYGHPHKEVIEGLRERGIRTLRTDEQGTIELITDGKSVQVR